MTFIHDCRRRALGLSAGLLALVTGGAALAQGRIFFGEPEEGGTTLQAAATSLQAEIQWLDAMLSGSIILISALVLGLLLWVIVFHNRRVNPVPARFTHNSPLEITWTVLPILYLIFVGSFTVPALFRQQVMPEPEITIKVTGYQWHWGYEYVDHDVEFLSFLLQRDELQEFGFEDRHYLLATDTAMVIPVGRDVVVQVTGADVIHSWGVPAFGVKQDGVPGRLAQLWFNVEREGVYFGQCYELCGQGHAYMPIVVEAVSEEAYIAWLEEQGAANLAAAPGYARHRQLAATD